MGEVEEAVCTFLGQHATRANLAALQAASRGLERRNACSNRLRERLRRVAEEMRGAIVDAGATSASFGARGRGRS